MLIQEKYFDIVAKRTKLDRMDPYVDESYLYLRKTRFIISHKEVLSFCARRDNALVRKIAGDDRSLRYLFQLKSD